MNFRKALKAGWLAMPILVSFLCSNRIAFADNADSATSQNRQVGDDGVQTYNQSKKNGGMITIGPGTATDGSTRLDLPPGLAGTSPMRIESGVAPTTPVEGDTWNDSTAKSFVSFEDGIKSYRSGVIFISTGIGGISSVAVPSTITANSTVYGTNTLPANFWVTGKTIRLKVMGDLSTGAAGSGTLTINVNFATTTIATSGAFTPVISVSSRAFTLEGLFTCTATGNYSAGGIVGQFAMYYSTANSGGLVSGIDSRVNAATLVDTTVASALNITVQWSGSAGNIFQPTNIVYEELN